jgi:hypothetical protein
VPNAVGVPLIVMVLADQIALTPAGKPLAPATPAFEIPVAPEVPWVIFISAVLIHKVGVVEAAADELEVITVIVPVAEILPQPPNNGML